MIRLAELKRRWRRISSSISFCARRRSSNLSALALFQRENLTSVDGRWFSGGGARIGNRRIGHFSAIIIILSYYSTTNKRASELSAVQCREETVFLLCVSGFGVIF